MSDLFADYLAPGGAEQLSREAHELRDQVVATRRRSRRTQLDSSADDPPDHLAFFVNHQIETRRLNVEGGEEIVELVEKWSRLTSDDVLPPLSPRKARSPVKVHGEPLPVREDVAMSRAVVESEEVIVEAQQEQRPPRLVEPRIGETSSSSASHFRPLSAEKMRRLLSYGDSQSQDRTTTSKSDRLHPLAPTSTPLLPSPAFQARSPPPPSAKGPLCKRRKIAPQVLAPSSTAPDPSPLDPPPPVATKATTHIDPTPTSSSHLTAVIPPPAAAPPPVSSPPSRPVARPSRKTHAARQRVLSILYRKMGGMRGPGGELIPFAPDGGCQMGGLEQLAKPQETPKQESFKTVSASVSPAEGGGGLIRDA